jgi:hypothetical protein
VPNQEGDKKRQVHHHEEWKAGDPGRVSGLWDEDVQDRQGLREKLVSILKMPDIGAAESGIFLLLRVTFQAIVT